MKITDVLNDERQLKALIGDLGGAGGDEARTRLIANDSMSWPIHHGDFRPPSSTEPILVRYRTSSADARSHRLKGTRLQRRIRHQALLRFVAGDGVTSRITFGSHR